ncbi:hypothetical protein LR48_Vigan10g132600 [Vigna angularis]|uniref:Uncharacterized protein n=1 Tax=Phaseolus angularis TaxID=3914 RepID=A0A0L9VL37_PHAAN|nr:hypothetical protein LR48_Vigan10g132600 [Vigna angularis]
MGARHVAALFLPQLGFQIWGKGLPLRSHFRCCGFSAFAVCRCASTEEIKFCYVVRLRMKIRDEGLAAMMLVDGVQGGIAIAIAGAMKNSQFGGDFRGGGKVSREEEDGVVRETLCRDSHGDAKKMTEVANDDVRRRRSGGAVDGGGLTCIRDD